MSTYGDDILRKYGLLPPERPAKGALGTGLDVAKALLQAPGALTGAIAGGLTGGFDPNDPYRQAMATNLQAITEGAPEAATFLEQARALPGAGQVIAEAVAPAPEGWEAVAARTGAIVGDIATDPLTWLGGVGLLSKGATAAKALRAGGVAKALEAGSVTPAAIEAAGLTGAGTGRLVGEIGRAVMAGPAAAGIYGPELVGGVYQNVKGAYETAQEKGLAAAGPQTAEALLQAGLGALMARGVLSEAEFLKTLRNDARIKQGLPTEEAEAAAQQPPFYPEPLPETPEGQMGLRFEEPYPIREQPYPAREPQQLGLEFPPPPAIQQDFPTPGPETGYGRGGTIPGLDRQPPPTGMGDVQDLGRGLGQLGRRRFPAQQPSAPEDAGGGAAVADLEGQLVPRSGELDQMDIEGQLDALVATPEPGQVVAAPAPAAVPGVLDKLGPEVVSQIPENLRAGFAESVSGVGVESPTGRVGIGAFPVLRSLIPEIAAAAKRLGATQLRFIGNGVQTFAFDIGGGRVLKVSNLGSGGETGRGPILTGESRGFNLGSRVTERSNINRSGEVESWVEPLLVPLSRVPAVARRSFTEQRALLARIRRGLEQRGIFLVDDQLRNLGLDPMGRIFIIDQGAARPLDLTLKALAEGEGPQVARTEPPALEPSPTRAELEAEGQIPLMLPEPAAPQPRPIPAQEEPRTTGALFKERGAREFPEGDYDRLFEVVRAVKQGNPKLTGAELTKEVSRVWRHQGGKAQKGVIARAIAAVEESDLAKATRKAEQESRLPVLPEPVLDVEQVAGMSEEQATTAFAKNKNRLYELADELGVDLEMKVRGPKGVEKFFKGEVGEQRLVREVILKARKARGTRIGDVFPNVSVEAGGVPIPGRQAREGGGLEAVVARGDEAAFAEASTAAAEIGIPAEAFMGRVREAAQRAEAGKPVMAQTVAEQLNALEKAGFQVAALRRLLGKGAGKQVAKVAAGKQAIPRDPLVRRVQELVEGGDESPSGMLAKLRQEFPDRTLAAILNKMAKPMLAKAAREAKARLDKPSGEALGGAPVDPDRLRDLVTVGADMVVRGVDTVAKFGAQLVREFGDWVKPLVRQVWNEAKRLARNVRQSFSVGPLPGEPGGGTNLNMLGLQDLWERVTGAVKKAAGPAKAVELPGTFTEAAAARQRLGPEGVAEAEAFIGAQPETRLPQRAPPETVEKALRTFLDTTIQGPYKPGKPTRPGAADDVARNQFRNLLDNQLQGREQEALDVLEKEFERHKAMTFRDVEEDAARLLLSGDPDELFARIRKQGNKVNPAEDTALRMYANMLETKAALQARLLERRLASGQVTKKELVKAQEQLLDAAAYKALTMVGQSVDAGTNAARVLSMRRLLVGTASDADMLFGRLAPALRKAGVPKDELNAVLGAALHQPHEFIPRLRAAMKSTAMDKFLEWYISGLVSGPQTRAANIGSNAIFRAVRDVEHGLSTGIDALVSKVTGKQRERFLGEIPFMLAAYRQALPEAIQMWMKTKAWEPPKWDPADVGSKHDLPIRKFAGAIGPGWGPVTNTIRALGWKSFDFGELARIPLKGLDIDDGFFKHLSTTLEIYREAYRRAARSGGSKEAIYRNASDWVGKFLRDGEQLPQKRQFKDVWDRATKAALDDTFQTPLEGLFARIRDTSVAHPLLRLIIPFITTPTNIAREALKRTPLALLPGGSTWKAWKKALYGQDSTGAAIDETAKTVFGGLLGFVVAQAALSGEITGGGPVDPAKQEVLRGTGWQPYSVKAGDQYISFSRFEPISSVMGMAADFAEALRINDPSAGKLGEKLAAAVVENITSKTFLSGFEGLVTAIHDPRQYADRFLKQQATSLLPMSGMSRALTRATDPYFRETELGPSVLEANIPGLSTQLPPQTKPTGEPRERPGATALERFASPFTRSKIRTDLVARVSQELDEVSYPPSRPRRYVSVNGRKVYLTAEERTVLAKAQQEATKTIGERLLSDPNYQNLPPNEEALEGPFDTRRTRKDVLENVYRRARKRAMAQIMPDLRARLAEAR